jgi:general secretion pathway protein C
MKQIFFIIHLLLLTLTAYQGVKIMYKGIESTALGEITNISDNITIVSEQTVNKNKISHDNQNQAISRRNIFNVQIESGKAPTTKTQINQGKKLEKTELNIALWGTVIGGSQSSSYAVIEDKKKRTQSLFQVGDVIQQASIKEIMRSRIILSFNGKDQVLEVDTSLQSSTMAANNSPEPNTDIRMQNQEGVSSSLIKQARQLKIRPYFKKGEPNGLLLYGIRPGSAPHGLGLKNGDVVREVNGSPTLTVKDAQEIYQGLEGPSDITFTILRRGREKQIVYSAENNSYTEREISKE